MTTKGQELKNCTPVKTILMLTIVLYHSIVIFAGTWGPYQVADKAPILGYMAEWMNSWHIYALH